MTIREYNSRVTEMYGALRLFSFKFTSNQEDAEDLLQETVLKALTYRDRFRENTNFKAWIFTIMRNLFINQYRKTHHTKVKITSTDYAENSHIASYNASNIESQHDFNQLRGKIKELNASIRVPFELFLEGFKYQEIADQLQIPIGTVKTRIFTARKQLSKAAQYV